MIKQKVLEAYSDGSPLELIARSFNITYEEVKNILIDYKEDSRYKKTFTDEFKIMIAMRDISGVARSTIAQELSINISTVKKSCEKFGQAIKEKATSDLAYTKIDGEFDLKTCPSCGSSKNNLVDVDITYCMSCDTEHEYHKGYVLRVNFEYLEE